MKKILDNFSKQSGIYKKYRPTYPKELFNELLQLTEGRNMCWDCGTGNGQVAVVLSNYFKTVYATDISENQILNATKKNNITYSLQRAGNTSFENDQFDMITVAQAIHWFDFDAFNKEMKRVAKNGAIVGVWGYGLLRIGKSIDSLIDQFYKDRMGSYWNPERKHVDSKYTSIPLDFTEIEMKKRFSIQVRWTLEALEGYFNSWSSVQNYMAKNNENPTKQLIGNIKRHWNNGTTKEVRFPIFTRIGKIEK